MTVNKLPHVQGIYKIIFPNGKIYIGLSKDIHVRIKEHLAKDYYEHPELPISKAIHKYGIENVEIIEQLDNVTREFLQNREIYWINYYDSTNHKKGYNLSKGGDGASPGWDNHQAKLSKEQLFALYNDLLYSSLTYEEIGTKYNLTRESIGRINAGTRYFQEGFNYPLRKERLSRYGLENKQDAFYGREDELQNLINDLLNTNISLKDLSIKYKIGSSTMTAINQGKKYHSDEYNYPLRKGGSSKVATRIFSEKEILQIKELLENPKYSMTEIGKILKCDRKVIASINQGTRQKQDNWDYPLRKFNMKTGPKKL